GKFGGKGKGQFKMDPNQIFDFASKGRGYYPIEEAMWGRDALEAFAKKEGITDGKLTKEQFLKYWEERTKAREEAVRDGKDPQTPGGPPKGPGGGTEEGKGPGKKKGFDPEALFKMYDTNGDGFLNESEIAQTKSFKDEWQKWDANKDGLI